MYWRCSLLEDGVCCEKNIPSISSINRIIRDKSLTRRRGYDIFINSSGQEEVFCALVFVALLSLGHFHWLQQLERNNLANTIPSNVFTFNRNAGVEYPHLIFLGFSTFIKVAVRFLSLVSGMLLGNGRYHINRHWYQSEATLMTSSEHWVKNIKYNVK